MKRTMALIFAVVFTLCTFTSTGLAVSGNGAVKATALCNFKASTTEFTVGESHEVTFTVDVKTSSAGMANASVYDSDGNLIAKLKDNGKNGDIKRNDGIYTAKINVFQKESKTVSYKAVANGIESNAFEINYFRMITPQELVIHERFWQDTEAFDAKLKADASITDYQRLKTIYKYISESSAIDAASMVWDTDYSFSFNFKSGITGFYACHELSDNHTQKAQEYSNYQSESIIKGIDTASWENPNVLVFRPYRNTPSMGSFSNEFYSGIAANICDVTGGTYNDCIESEAYPGNLKNIDRYGFFFIDSHGTLSGGKSYMIMRKGNTSNYEYSADISAGHIITSGSDIAVTGSFFTKYIGNQGKQMPKTMLYLIICHGMQTNTISSPAMACGASLAVGYTESVSFSYDFDMSRVVWNCMTTIHPNHPERTYTITEAMAKARQQCGSVDPYGVAQITYAGNGDFVLYADDFDPITDVSLSETQLSLYINNTHQLSYTVEPSNGNLNYTAKWSSSNSAVASVNENGLVYSHGQGEAVITLTITDNATETPVTIQKTCTVLGLGILHVTGLELDTINLELFEGTSGEKIQAHVLPRNATNQSLTFTSNNTDIVTVDINGNVKPIKQGSATVTVTTADGGFSHNVTCMVTKAQFDTSINISGSMLEFETSGAYPFVSSVHDGRVCVASTNQGVNSSKSEVSLNAGYLKAGSIIKFDWSISSEVNADKFVFYVNGSPINYTSGLKTWKNYTHTITTSGNYSFKWAYEKDINSNSYSDTAWLCNVDLFKFDELHTVTFLDKDQTTVLGTAKVSHGEAATAPAVPVYEGLSFVGWSLPITHVRSDLRVYAIYTNGTNQNACTVTFIMPTGNVIGTVQVPYGEAATAPTAPQIDGYIFIGWDKDISSVTENMTVTAIYAQLGDVNLNGVINTGDAILLLKHIAEIITLNGNVQKVADFNQDGRINTGDVIALLKFVAN